MEIEGLLREFRDKAGVAHISREDQRVFGYFCTYFPVELVHAAGLLPIRILGERKPLVYVDAYLPSFGCSFVRTAMELGLDGSLNHLSGIGFSHTCDSMQVLSGLWGMVFKDQLVHNILFPSKLNDPGSFRFLLNELQLFRRRLEEYTGAAIDEAQLWNSIHIYQKKRALLNELYELRKRCPGALKGSDLLRVVKSGVLSDPEQHNRLLERLLPHVRESAAAKGGGHNAVKVVLAGNFCAFPDIVEIIEGCGAVVVDDQLCTGARSFMNVVDRPESAEETDALSHIAGVYLNKFPCPAKYHSEVRRDNELFSAVTDSGADGVIFLLIRLCDPYAYDYTFLKKALGNKGYPSLVVEYEQQTESFEQLQTRVEAFVESIKE
jgi:bcr-type benzoyl-CoA reductase subunit C